MLSGDLDRYKRCEDEFSDWAYLGILGLRMEGPSVFVVWGWVWDT